MIANKKRSTMTKSKARHISDMLDYILKEGQHITEQDSIAHAGAINCEAGLKSYEALKHELTETAELSTRSKNPMCHIVLSFKMGEHPTKEQAEEAVKIVLKETGYDRCKTVYALHDNTDNHHIHIAVNRVNRETGKCCSDSNDIYKIHKALAKIEHAQGWQREAGGLYVVIDNELHAAVELKEPQHKLSEGARMSELHSGMKSVERVATEDIKEILLSSKSWPELHERLSFKSFSYEQRGPGAVVCGLFEDGSREVKASAITNKASLKKLEQKFSSPFQPSKIKNIKPRPPEPLVNSNDPAIQGIIETYTAERIEKNIAVNQLYKEHEAAKQKLTEERKAIYEVMYQDSEMEGKGLALDALKSVLSEYHKEQLENLSESYQEKIESGKQALKSISDFEVWLALNCPERQGQEIKNLLTKAVNKTVQLEAPVNNKHEEKVNAFIEYHAAVNADRYRVTARGEKDGKPIAFVFDRTNGVSEGYTPNEVIKQIGRMSRFEQKMEHIYLTPISEDKIHLLVDDMTPKSLDAMKNDGFIPSCVIQSSPNSIQAIFTMPKPQTANIKEAVNAISRGLNTRYGDINLSGAEHAHRAPGFMNPKLKYQDKDGGFPKARIIETNKNVPCEKILSFIAYQAEITAERLEQQQKSQGVVKTAVKKDRQPAHIEKSLYNAHRASILEITGFGSNANDSRLDAMIAERLRATGHSQVDIERILEAGVNPARHKAKSYPALTAAHAFSADASYRIDMLKPYHQQWKSLETHTLEKVKAELERQEKEKQQAAQREKLRGHDRGGRGR